MDFIDRLQDLATQIPRLKEKGLITTEEGTKNALVMPFINALGYNVFDPTEVTPELTADVGTKKGEKVDYAIMREGKPIILIECKCCGTDLDKEHASQLYRYFSVTEARFGVLTDGVEYRFFSDLDAPNKMDERPFLIFDMLEWDTNLVEELKKFAKPSFDVDQILSTASDLKYTRALKGIIRNQLTNPDEGFVRFFASQVYSGRLTQNVLNEFAEITKKAWREVINERMQQTFAKAAFGDDNSEVQAATQEPPTEKLEEVGQEVIPENKVETTHEELEGYHIIRAIVREVVEVSRIATRDVQSYFSILFDDNNRKPICRLYFNTSVKRIGLFDKDQEERIEIKSVDDIYKYADRLRASAKQYLD